jgi:hypothetical protein
MRWMRRLTMVAAMLAVVVVGATTPAQASKNVGWIYSTGGGAAAYFDADLNGAPGVESVTICDKKANGRGAVVHLDYFNAESDAYLVKVKDPSHDDTCATAAWNMFLEETTIWIYVCEYAAGDEFNCVTAYGVA